MNMKKSSLLAVFLLLSFCLWASPLTVEEAIDSAKNHDADYSLALRQYSNAVSITEKENSLTPSLSVSGSVKTGAGFFSSQSGLSPSWEGISGNVGIASSFTFSGSTLNEKETKALSNESALLTLENEEDSLKTSVISGYFSIVKTRDSISLAESTLEQAKRQLESVNARYEAGLASQLELVQAENSVSSAEYTLENYRSAYSLYLMSFRNLTGLDVTDVELMDASDYEIQEILSSDELFTKYAYSSPTIKSLELSQRSAELSYDTTRKSSTIPTLTVSASYTINGSVQSKTGNTRTSSISDGLSLSAGVSVPLSSYLSSSSSAAALEKAKNSATDAKTKLTNALSSFRETLESSCQTIELLTLQIENQEKTLSALEKEYSLTQDAYYAGEVSLSTLQSCENSVLSARYSLLSLKYTYIQSLYSLSVSLGVSYTDLLKG